MFAWPRRDVCAGSRTAGPLGEDDHEYSSYYSHIKNEEIYQDLCSVRQVSTTHMPLGTSLWCLLTALRSLDLTHSLSHSLAQCFSTSDSLILA